MIIIFRPEAQLDINDEVFGENDDEGDVIKRPEKMGDTFPLVGPPSDSPGHHWTQSEGGMKVPFSLQPGSSRWNSPAELGRVGNGLNSDAGVINRPI